MKSNIETMLANISPVLGVAALVLVLITVGKKIWLSGMEGKHALKSIIWYSVVVAMCYKPILIINIGNMLIRIVTNILALLGFGGLEGGV